MKTTFDPQSNSYSSVRTNSIDYERKAGDVQSTGSDENGDGIILGGGNAALTRNFEVVEVDGRLFVVDNLGSNTINIFEFNPDSETLSLLSSTPGLVSDEGAGFNPREGSSIVIHNDGSGFSIVSEAVFTPQNGVISQRFDLDGQPVGNPEFSPFTTSGLRTGFTVTADVDNGSGGTISFSVSDHDFNDALSLALISNNGTVGNPVQQASPASGLVRSTFEGFSARIPQDGGADRTFVYFAGRGGQAPSGIEIFEIDRFGRPTFIGREETTITGDRTFSETFTDGAGTVFVTIDDDFFRINSDGTLDRIATHIPVGDRTLGEKFDFAVFNDSLHVVRYGPPPSDISYHDLNVPAVPLPPPGPVPCFVEGTLIETDRGPRPIETITTGDLIVTRDNGLQPVRWIGDTILSGYALRKNPQLSPIRIAPHAFGPNVPAKVLIVSPQHRMLVSSRIVQRMTGEDEILIPAVKLLGFPGVERVSGNRLVHYFHLLLDRHEIITANGAPTESLLIGEYLAEHLDQACMEEIAALFPDLFDNVFARDSARMIVKKGGVVRKLLERHEKNGLGLSPGVLPDQINVEPLALHMA